MPCCSCSQCRPWRKEQKRKSKLTVISPASNYLAYPGPKQKLTKAPEGYTPYYISHYGRHGSRYLINPAQYSDAVNILAKADSLDKLSPRGHDVLNKVRMLAAEAQGRLGELTPLGAEQHRGIAHRMYMRFPQVFNGNVHVDARSTVVIRCILSMENELLELARLNPRLVITNTTSCATRRRLGRHSLTSTNSTKTTAI